MMCIKQKHKSVTVVPAQNWLQLLTEEVCDGVTREKVDPRPVGIVQEPLPADPISTRQLLTPLG